MPPGTTFTSIGPEAKSAAAVGHVRHAALPGFDADPHAHAVQLLAPLTDEKVPAGQEVQGGLPEALNVPGAHCAVQLHDPICDEDPEGHV
jgi:hypothetical protein